MRKEILKTSSVIQSGAKNLGNIIRAFILFLLMLFVASCEHRPLVESEFIPNTRYVRIYLDENIRNVAYGFYDETKEKPVYKTPQVMRLTLSDIETERVKTEAYLTDAGKDERGNYLEGKITAPPGVYHLVGYNFDTESVHVGYEYDYERMYAYTNEVSEEVRNRLNSVRNVTAGNWKGVYEPDHFFIATHETIEVHEETDTLKTEKGDHLTATTGVKTYYLQIQVEGVSYISSASAFLSGMAGNMTIHNRQLDKNDPVAVFFELNNGKDKGRQDKSVAYATFNTFGKLDTEENLLKITFEFLTRDGRIVTKTIPLTELFSTEMVRVNQWIIIDETIVIDPMEEDNSAEGITPNVGEWENTEGEIFI